MAGRLLGRPWHLQPREFGGRCMHDASQQLPCLELPSVPWNTAPVSCPDTRPSYLLCRILPANTCGEKNRRKGGVGKGDSVLLDFHGQPVSKLNEEG